MGKVRLLQSQPELAIQTLNRAVKMAPFESAIYDVRACAKMGLLNFNGALRDENEAIRLDSTLDLYYTNRGFIYFRLADYAKSIEDYNISLTIKKTQKAFANRGLAYWTLNKYNRAIADYTESLKIYPEDGEVLYHRGVCYLDMNEVDSACSDFRNSAHLGHGLSKERMAILCINDFSK